MAKKKLVKLEWTTKSIRLGDLKFLKINPRTITDEKREKLNRSLNKFNLVEIPAANIDLTIIAGNRRVEMMHLAGREDEMIDVRIPNRKLTEDEVKEYAVISNTHAGEFDFEMLDMEFSGIDFEDMGFEIHGFDVWQNKQEALKAQQAVEDDHEMPSDMEAVQTDIVLGDLIEIGRHRLICGSSTEVGTWEKLMQGQLADLVITDPPYNVDYVGKTKDALKIEGDNRTDSDFYQFLYDFYTALGAYTKAGGAWYVWHADSEGANFRHAMANSGIMVKQCLIWKKNTMVMGRQDYHWQHEPCLYGWKEGAAHGWYTDRKQTTILEFDRPTRSKKHPTMKPVPLIAYQMANSSKAGDVVADGFGGSGTTMLAAEQLDRTCYMAELGPNYCQVIVERMFAFNSNLKIKINGKDYTPDLRREDAG